MDEKKAVVVIAFAMVVFLLIGLIGCEGKKGPAGPQGPPGPSLIYIVGGVSTLTPWSVWSANAHISVFNSPAVPRVMINDIRISNRGELDFYNYSFPIFAGDSAKLVVTYRKPDGDSGTAQANIRLPGQFEITSHDTSSVDAIPVGASLSVTWSPSNGADAYSVYFHFDYYYEDTIGSSLKYFHFDCDTLLTDTSITFAPSVLFPNSGEIDTILSGYGQFSVSAIEGPWQEGADGNVLGDGRGFFYGWTFGGSFEFWEGGSTYLGGKGEEPTNRFREFLEKRREALNLY